MFGSSAVLDRGAAMSGLQSGVDGAFELDVHSLSGNELVRLMSDMDVELNRLASAQRKVIAEIDSRRLAGDFGTRSTADLVAATLRISRSEAGSRVHAARTFGERRALTGELLEPVVPLVAEALETGKVSVQHAVVISDLLDKLPGDIEAEHGIAAQKFLLEQSAQVDPPTLRKIAIRLRDTLDQDGAEDREKQQQRNRSFSFVENSDGTHSPRGRWTPALTTAVMTMLEPLAAPRRSEIGERDDRTYGQRMHDAMFEASKLVVKSGQLPASGGVATTIMATVTLDQLISGLGATTNVYGDLLPMSELAKLAVEAEIVPVVFDALGGVLAYGRSRRLAPPGLRRALAARDKGCILPGCDRPPAQTEAHHVTDWAKLGETNIDEMALLCDYDHDTFEARGWKIEMVDGVPWCTPPSWLDPDQVPRRNTAHDVMMTPIPESFAPARETSSLLT